MRVNIVLGVSRNDFRFCRLGYSQRTPELADGTFMALCPIYHEELMWTAHVLDSDYMEDAWRWQMVFGMITASWKL